MELFHIPYPEFGRFFLILIRVGVVLFLLPFFNSKTIPMLIKAGLALMIALILFPVAEIHAGEFPATVPGLLQLAAGELIMGIVLGFVIQIFFEGVQLMGQMVGFQTGFSITNIIDPQHGSQVSILANMAYLVAIVLFLLLNGHHILLRALRESFEIVQVGALRLNGQVLQEVVRHSGSMFVVGIKIGAPAIAALLFAKVVFGLITKLIPQMNIMIVAFPVQIVIGLLFFGISLRVLLFFVERYTSDLGMLLMRTLQWLKV